MLTNLRDAFRGQSRSSIFLTPVGEPLQLGRKIHGPCTLRPSWSGPPWNWVSAHGVKKLQWWGYWAEQEVWRYLQPSG